MRPPTHTHPRGQARDASPQATCPTLPCTQLDHWAPLGAPRGGTAGPKKLAPQKKNIGRFLAQNSAQWAKCTTGSAPFPHKVRGPPKAADPTPSGALSVPIVGETHLGQAGIWGQSWHSTGSWVEKLWKAEESSGPMGCRGLRPCEGPPEAHVPAIEIGGGAKGREKKGANKGQTKGHQRVKQRGTQLGTQMLSSRHQGDL